MRNFFLVVAASEDPHLRINQTSRVCTSYKEAEDVAQELLALNGRLTSVIIMVSTHIVKRIKPAIEVIEIDKTIDLFENTNHAVNTRFYHDDL